MGKRIALMIGIVSVMFALNPISVKAFGEEGTLCHCGNGIRKITQIENVSHLYNCPQHGASCSNYFKVDVKNFFHCTNAACDDVWYEYVRTYYTHLWNYSN